MQKQLSKAKCPAPKCSATIIQYKHHSVRSLCMLRCLSLLLLLAVQNSELVELLQERVRELEAEAATNCQQLAEAEQQLQQAQEAQQ